MVVLQASQRGSWTNHNIKNIFIAHHKQGAGNRPLYPFKEANMLKYFQKLFSKNVRKPATCGHIITLSGAVMIHTADGNVILAPGFVREILPQLTHAANEAAEHLST